MKTLGSRGRRIIASMTMVTTGVMPTMITSIVAARATPLNDDNFSFPFRSAMLAIWKAKYDIPGIENAGYPTENGEDTGE